jgi:Domain of unknown function (DUF4224)
MLLARADLEQLTGRKRAGAQRRALDAMGIVYLTGPDGHPRVLRSLVERLMGADDARAMIADHEPELCLEPPPNRRSPSATVRVLQTRRVLAGQKG